MTSERCANWPHTPPKMSSFDVFLSHASEDKIAVRTFARRLQEAGASVWLDEEQVSPGEDPQEAVVRALSNSRHVVIWITEAWLKKDWTLWELKQFAEAEKSRERRVVPVLLTPWNSAVLGPYLANQIAIPPERSDDERLWLTWCGLSGKKPGPADRWALRGQELLSKHRTNTQIDDTPPTHTCDRKEKEAISTRISPDVVQDGKNPTLKHIFLAGTAAATAVLVYLSFIAPRVANPPVVEIVRQGIPVSQTAGNENHRERNPQEPGTDFVSTAIPELVEIPAGLLIVPSGGTINVDSFWMCKAEITQLQWLDVMGSNPSNCHFGCEATMPVQQVSWIDTIKYLNKLSDSQGLTRCYRKLANSEVGWVWNSSCDGFRLPTEAEWVYAARAGSASKFHFGDSRKLMCSYGNVADTTHVSHEVGRKAFPCSDGFVYLAPARTFLPNKWGLYDIHGNVTEWIWDRFDESPFSHPEDVNVQRVSEVRTLRGGSFEGLPERARLSARAGGRIFEKKDHRGFRCARGPQEQG